MSLETTVAAIDSDAEAQAWAMGYRPGAEPEPSLPEDAPEEGPRVLDFTALAGVRAPAKHWFRQGWLTTGVGNLSAKGGDGKSTVVQHEATAGAIGRAYFAPECAPYRSLVINCEDDHDDMWRRQERICDHEQIDMASLAGKLHLVSRSGCENALMVETRKDRVLIRTPLFDELREQVNDLGIDVLWLDNAAHVFLGNHDDRTQVTQFINQLNGLVKGRPFGVVIIAHVSRAQGSEYSGSVAWENAARMRWYLGSKLPDQPQAANDDDGDQGNVRYLAKRKSNYSARDYVRMTMREGLLVPDHVAQSHVGGLVSAMDDRRAEEVCIAGFRTLCGMGIRTTDGKTSPDYLPSQMVAKGLALGYTKSDLGRAMNRLMGGHVFTRAQIGQHSNRSPKFGLVLKDEAA